jgi:hypothetical protein
MLLQTPEEWVAFVGPARREPVLSDREREEAKKEQQQQQQEEEQGNSHGNDGHSNSKAQKMQKGQKGHSPKMKRHHGSKGKHKTHAHFHVHGQHEYMAMGATVRDASLLHCFTASLRYYVTSSLQVHLGDASKGEMVALKKLRPLVLEVLLECLYTRHTPYTHDTLYTHRTPYTPYTRYTPCTPYTHDTLYTRDTPHTPCTP